MAERERKGFFGEWKLPVAARYVLPIDRTRMVWAGLAATAVVLVLAALDLTLLGGRWLSAGPLSGHHAAAQAAGDCTICHTAFAAVESEKCSGCHERFRGPFGVHGFDAHYLYESGDHARLVKTAAAHEALEIPCAGCHPEHQGRDASITRVSDAQCARCHAIGSFAGHPEFDFAAIGELDDGALAFTHVRHVRRILERDPEQELETTCLYCHHPDPEGRGFRPIDFERHCESCHLTGLEETEAVPVRGAGDAPGALTPQAIRARREPGTSWALLARDDAYSLDGGEITKSGLVHADPWVMFNLRELRRGLHPGAELADLLRSSADVAPGRGRLLYQEAVDTLAERVADLRARPGEEVQGELDWASALLVSFEHRLTDPFAELDPAPFRLPEPEDGGPAPAAVEAAARVVEGLTSECQKCHVIREFTIARVDADQRALRRARFDHGAHVLDRGCLDCHARIPIAEHARSDEKLDPALERAEIQNLPGIGTCRSCHGDAGAPDDCSTCHDFHPHKEGRVEMVMLPESG